MSSDEMGLREQLCLSWRSVSDQLILAGMPRRLVVETMVMTALKELEESHDALEAASLILASRRSRRGTTPRRATNGNAAPEI